MVVLQIMKKGFCFKKISDHTINLDPCFLICDFVFKVLMFVFKQRKTNFMVLGLDYILWGNVIQ